jgi:hypothetical protein
MFSREREGQRAQCVCLFVCREREIERERERCCTCRPDARVPCLQIFIPEECIGQSTSVSPHAHGAGVCAMLVSLPMTSSHARDVYVCLCVCVCVNVCTYIIRRNQSTHSVMTL